MIRCHLSISLDGFVAGPNQSGRDPLGEGAERLHEWMFVEPLDSADAAARADITTGGAYIMGRNMFGPLRGEWTGDWRGWWGDDPPYRAPVFVLTHHPREPVQMRGGTTFHFVTEGIEAALERAGQAAGERDVMIAGGASCVRQYLRAGLLEELNVHIAPVLLGDGERLFEDLSDTVLTPAAVSGSSRATHVRYRGGA